MEEQTQQEEPQVPELMSPEEVETVVLISDDQCTPCKLVHEHLKKMEKDGKYPGTIEVIDPLSDEADRFYDNDGNIALPSALIKKKDGSEEACEIFMDEETLALQCEGKLLIINDAPQEIIEEVEGMIAQSSESTASPAPAPVSTAATPLPPAPTAAEPSPPPVATAADDLPTPP